MTSVEIDKRVFNTAYLPYLDCTARTQIFYGGSSSGKSVFVVGQRTVYDLMRGGRNYLIVRQVARTVRNSVYNEILKVIAAWGVSNLFTISKSEMVITCTNGYQILFGGLDDVEKMKSITPAKGVITDIVIEEATETEKATVKQLYKRQRGGKDKYPKRLVLLFNPILQTHWIYEEYFSVIGWTDKQSEYKADDGSLTILKTTYKDNKFLTRDDVHDLESEPDPYYFNVYTLGNWGILGNVIFTRWSVEDLSSMTDQFTSRKHGLDFGFSSDPAAMVVTHYDRKKKTIYIYDELYQTGLTNDLLADEIKKLIGHWRDEDLPDEAGNVARTRVFSHTDPVTCDSAEPKSIAELKRYKVNARPAKKGKDSVNHGIQWLQQQTITIDARCINTRNEFMQYKWKEDSAGHALPEPIDKNNHAIDGLRYAYEEESLHQEAGVIDDPFSNW